jgi:hypothetical protein
MWRFPQLDLVSSGYGDMFTDEELQRNEDLRDIEPGWDRIVKRSGAAYAVLPPDDKLAYALTRFLGWTVMERSEFVVLLHAPAS